VTPEEWQRAKALIEDVINRPPHARQQYVAACCGDNVRLREEIESMLATWNEPSGNGTRDSAGSPAAASASAVTASGVGSDAGRLADAAVPAMPAGSRLGRYEIVTMLGAGGMGIVYLASDAQLDRNVAIKVLPPAFASDPERRRRFEHEGRAAASLNHPNIVSVYDVGFSDGAPYIVMEYARGDTLAAQLGRGRLPRDRTLQIGAEIAAALVEAHAHNVAHRDLKPGNVMVTPEGVVKVLDFGIAKTILPDAATTVLADEPADERQTQFGQLLGTPGYMSPEQLLGVQVDVRADIYSLGVILFELVTGRPPFEDDRLAARRRTANENPARSACEVDTSVPVRVSEVIARAMDVDPSRRPSAAVLRAELTALIAHSPAARADVPSVAVLSFTDMSAARDQEFFCDGIAEELINALARIPKLRVAARTSAFQFKGRAKDVRVIGDALNVATVLDGSVRKAGRKVRITVELINTADGYQIWSERFDRNLEDIFAVQEEIANSVANTLKGRLVAPRRSPARPQRRKRVEAYASYLEGRYHWNKRTEDDLRKSVVCFERAIQRDPEYAEAYAALADAYVTIATYGVEPASAVMPRATAALQKALEIDSSLAAAYACRASVRSVYEWAWPAAEGDYRKAMALQPGYATAHHLFAINHLVPLARFEEAREQLRLALDVDPLGLAVRTSLGMTAYFAGAYDDAARTLLDTIELENRFGMAHLFLGATYTEQRKYVAAREQLEVALTMSGQSPEILAASGYLSGLSGETERARAILADLRRLAQRRYVSPARLAQVHIGLDERAEALACLERAKAERAADLAWLGVRPVFATLRGDAAFQRLITSMDLPTW
jgi:serine/threonine-protein kinase